MSCFGYAPRVTLLACTLAAGSGHAWAQEPAGDQPVRRPTRLQGGAGVVGAAAIGQFGTFVPDGAGGLLAHLDIGIRDSIFSVGGELGWLSYGDEKRTVSLGSLIPEVPDAAVDVNTVNEMLTLHARLRAQRPRGRWRPYVDGLLGFVNIYTKSEVTGGGACSEVDCDASVRNADQTHSRDFVLSYGGGAGVMIGLSTRRHIPRLDVSVRYLRGGTARYLTEGALRVESGQLVRDFSQSRTDVVDLYIGVAFGR